MALKTTLEQLEEVQTAISSIISGTQSYSINGRSMTKADLPALLQYQTLLQTKYGRETATGSPINIGTLRRED